MCLCWCSILAKSAHAVVGVFSTHNTCVSNSPTMKIFVYFIDNQYINHKITLYFKIWRVAFASVVGRKNTNNGTKIIKIFVPLLVFDVSKSLPMPLWVFFPPTTRASATRQPWKYLSILLIFSLLIIKIFCISNFVRCFRKCCWSKKDQQRH